MNQNETATMEKDAAENETLAPPENLNEAAEAWFLPENPDENTDITVFAENLDETAEAPLSSGGHVTKIPISELSPVKPNSTPVKVSVKRANQDETAEAVPEQPVKKKKKANKRRKKIIRRIITFLIILAILGGIAYGLSVLLADKPTSQEALTEFTYLGSIQSSVTGSGVTNAADTAVVASKVSGLVNEVYVNTGDYVFEGTPLFSIDTAIADAEIQAAEEKLADLQEALGALYDKLSEIYASQAKLTISAPFSGKLMDVQLEKGNYVSGGTVIGTLVNDSKMRLTQYFSYAYENQIKPGMTAQVSIPSSMSVINGVVESVSMVQRISPEGSMLFEAVVVLDNPGTLTEGTLASVVIIADDGGEIYSYETGGMEFFEKRAITAEVSGTCETLNMRSYYTVSAGDILAVLSSETYVEEIRSMEKQIATAQEGVNTQLEVVIEKEKALENYNATAPISGTVMSNTFFVGTEVTAGSASISISDTSSMYVEMRIDEMDIGKVEVGMMVELNQWGDMTWYGTITQISLEGKYENGVSYFPATVMLYNDGSLMSGMYLNYNLVTSVADEAVIAPVQAVKYTEYGTCLFIRSETQPENAILDLGEDVVPAGFYAVPVEIGLSDDYGAQITGGVDSGVEVFTSYLVTSGDSWG